MSVFTDRGCQVVVDLTVLNPDYEARGELKCEPENIIYTSIMTIY